MLTLPGVLHSFGIFYRFCGVLRCLSQLSIDGVKAGQSCFEKRGPRHRFLTEIQDCYSVFLSNGKKDSPFVPFSSQLENFFFLSAPIRTIFAPLRELSTFIHLSTSAELEIKISNQSSTITAT